MSVTVLDPTIHLVKDTKVARFFRRKLSSSDPMTFWHALTGQWILGLWIHKSQRLVEELEDLGPNCEAVTPEFVEMIVRGYGAVDFAKKKKRLLSRQRSIERKKNEDIANDQERWDWLKKKTKDKMPIPYAYNVGGAG